MFDIVLASSPGTSFAGRLARSLRSARMRVISCEIAPLQPPLTALSVDAAVACGPTGHAMLDVARSVRGALAGPPPVVGVSGAAPVSAPAWLAGSFSEDVSDATLIAHVQRAAARAERTRSRVVLRGDLDDVGLESLLASLAGRQRSCFVHLRSGDRRAEVTLDGGRPTHVRVDGMDTSRDPAGAIAVLAGWSGASFEVLAIDDGATVPAARAVATPSDSPGRGSPPSSTRGAADARNVALAAAVVNACAAYARTFLGPSMAARLLTSTLSRALEQRPTLDAFTVSREGMVSVAHVERARSALPDGMAAWMGLFFAEAAALDPVRFRAVQLRDVLGGLARLVEQVGWASALLEGKRGTTEGS